MQINVSKISGSKVEVNVVVPADVVKTHFNSNFKKVAKNARVDGFRKGKVPAATVLAMFSDRISEETFNELFSQVFFKAAADNNFVPVKGATPEVANITPINPEADFSFSYTVEVFPSLEDKDLKSIQQEIVKVEIDDADIENVVNELRKQQSKLEVVEGGEIAAGTVAKIDFLGKKDGVPFEGGKAENYDLDIDNAKMIPGFIESLMGHKAGEEFVIECTFPENYGVEELQGAKATFDINVKQVSKRVLPEVDDAFLAAFGFEGKSVEEFKKSLADNLKHQADALSLNYNLTSIVSAITNSYGEFEVPATVVESTAGDFVKRQFGGKADARLVEALRSAFLPRAESKVREDCVVQTLIAKHKFNLEVTTADVDALIEEQSISYDDPEEFKVEVKKDSGMLANLSYLASSRKLFSCLKDLVSVSEVTKNFNDFKDLLAKAEQEREEQERAKMMAKVEPKQAESASEEAAE